MNIEQMERRILHVTQRVAGNDDKPVIEGDAAVFNQETVIGAWFREMIAPGAFRRVLSEKPDVVAALNHNWDKILGRTTAGTLSLEESDAGLRYTIEINPDDTEAMNTYRKVKRGDVTQASFAFTVRTEEWVSPSNGSNELPLRIIKEVDQLYDVGPCTFGAYPEASASARSKASEFQKPVDRQEPEADDPEPDPQEQIEKERRRLEFFKIKINP